MLRTLEKLRPLEPNGLAARLVLAVLTTAGVLYANVGPLIVSGLTLQAEFTRETAGYVFAANMYGSAVGGFVIILLVERVRWKPAAFALLALIVAVDLASAWTDRSTALLTLRFCHGLAGGALIGVGMSVVARMTSPEKTFAILILIQLLLGGTGVAVLTPLLEDAGVRVVWLSLVGFSGLALLLLPLLGDYPMPARSQGSTAAAPTHRAPLLVIILAMSALFLYQAGEMAAFAYMIELGNHYLFDVGFLSVTIAMSLWVGAPAALLVAWWSTRSGRLRPVVVGVVGTGFVVALLLVPAPAAFVVANVGFGVFFSISIPYLLGLVSEMDDTGRMAALGGFVNSLGLATGPALAATLVGAGDVPRAVVLGVGLLAVSLVLVVYPAAMLDRRSKHGRVSWS